MEFSMLTVSEIEQLRSNGVRSLSPGDFNWLCAMALELANEYESLAKERDAVADTIVDKILADETTDEE
jgi:hypothetical protein